MEQENIIIKTIHAINYIRDVVLVVQVEGVCPICKTGRNQYGECYQGHIVFENFNKNYQRKEQDA